MESTGLSLIHILINGSTASLAVLCIALSEAKRLLAYADVSAALSIEAIRGELAAFDDRVHQARRHPGQIECAKNLRRLLSGTQRCTEKKMCIRDSVSPMCSVTLLTRCSQLLKVKEPPSKAAVFNSDLLVSASSFSDCIEVILVRKQYHPSDCLPGSISHRF